MVCSRCKMVVEFELEKLGLHAISIVLDEVELVKNFKENQKRKLVIKLQSQGFELLEDKSTILTEKIKCLIIDVVHHQNNKLKINLSEDLSQDLSTLGKLFSESEEITIEHYFVA